MEVVQSNGDHEDIGEPEVKKIKTEVEEEKDWLLWITAHNEQLNAGVMNN